MLLRFERIECCLLGRTELRKRKGIAQVEAAVQGAQLALENSALDEGRKVGGLDLGTLGGEGRDGNPGVAVVFGLGLEGQLKVAEQGFGLELGARKRREGAVDGPGIVARRRKAQRPHSVVAQGVGGFVVGLDLHEAGHRGRQDFARRAEVVFGHPVP